ncbi:helicase/secretion neighborhood TadE-like protein [Microbacterium sp. cf046]|uniref:helicase n=1 Tax=Microbacterium sp. cf046 TaxID=1761803 RepID=UPI0008DF2D1E|nr:helicase [Microbacterium sp. cf046]SFS16425.1 helicase/secretion neighborhood TadE-like protein [Microbacterium sp. cf046]
MPGTILSVGIVACAATLAVSFTTAGAGAVFSQRVAGIADAAALAAADAASGSIGGEPCERAAEIAAVSGAVVTACDLDGLVATVTVSAPFGRLPCTVSARAGPPGG